MPVVAQDFDFDTNIQMSRKASKSEFVRPRDKDLSGTDKKYIGLFEFKTLMTP